MTLKKNATKKKLTTKPTTKATAAAAGTKATTNTPESRALGLRRGAARLHPGRGHDPVATQVAAPVPQQLAEAGQVPGRGGEAPAGHGRPCGQARRSRVRRSESLGLECWFS